MSGGSFSCICFESSACLGVLTRTFKWAPLVRILKPPVILLILITKFYHQQSYLLIFSPATSLHKYEWMFHPQKLHLLQQYQQVHSPKHFPSNLDHPVITNTFGLSILPEIFVPRISATRFIAAAHAARPFISSSFKSTPLTF